MSVPQKAVAVWLGHSESVSSELYLQVPDELYDRAAGRRQEPEGEGAAKGAAESAAVVSGTDSQGVASVSNHQNVAHRDDTEKQGVFCNPESESSNGPGAIRTRDQAIMSQLPSFFSALHNPGHVQGL